MTAVEQPRAAPAPVPAKQTRQKSSLMRTQRLWGWIFLSPWLIGFVVFTAAPILASLYFSFTDFNLGNPQAMQFVGLRNWEKLFNDPLLLTALSVTLRFALIAVPIGIILPLALAALLNSKYLIGTRIWRTLFYMTYLVPVVSTIFIWQSFLNGQTGWLNRLLRVIGIQDPPNWLGDANTILIGFIFMG